MLIEQKIFYYDIILKAVCQGLTNTRAFAIFSAVQTIYYIFKLPYILYILHHKTIRNQAKDSNQSRK